MQEDLSRLSSADIRRFEKTVSEAKALTARQEEIAKKVLNTEKEIGKIRLASLNEYFDEYSKGLDEIIARKTSQLNDAFLIMEQKALESFKRTANEIATAAPKDKQSESDSATRSNNATQETVIRVVHEQLAASDEEKVSSKPTGNTGYIGSSGGGDEPPSSPPSGPNTPDGGTPPPGDVLNSQLTDDSKTSQLGDAETAAARNTVERFLIFNKHYKTAQEQLNAITSEQEDAIVSLSNLKELQDKKDKERLEKYGEREKALAGTLTELMLARQQAEELFDKNSEIRQNRLKDLRIANVQEVAAAEANAQNLINETVAARIYTESPEAFELEQQKKAAAEKEKSAKELESERLDYIDREERKFRRKNNRERTAEEKAELVKLANEKYKLDEKNLESLTKKRADAEAKAAKEKQGQGAITDFNTLLHGKTWEERKEAWNNLTHDETGEKDYSKLYSAATATMVKALTNYLQKLDKTIDDIGSYKSAIDTRLQGTSGETLGKHYGSYWDQIVKDITSVGAVNPYFKQSDFASNVKSLVEQGIAFDLEQRAFLMTIQSKIANTFDVADGTLLRLIRIQQEDTTAGRLGMEAALNSFLNEMYANTEYLQQVADSVRGSLEEMQSLMEGAEAAEVEYQVQKWMGSLYSVGMSDAAVNSISTALGQIAAGQIEGLTGGGAGNLLVMAANDAGLSIADILAEGLDSEKTNDLLQAVVNYLAEIADSSKGNNVIQQQLADVFGVKASDLRAATNLTTKNSVSAIYDNAIFNGNDSYNSMVSYLTSMANSMGDRTSFTEKMTNIWENIQYSMAGGIASNPVTFGIYKMATLLDDTVGGIPIPDISLFGSGVALNTTVADIMRVASMAGGIIDSWGSLMDGLSNSFSGQAMLNQLGISSTSGIEITPRGDGGFSIQTGGGSTSTSGSGYVGNASGSDIKNSTMQATNDDKKQLMIEAQEEEEANDLDVLNATVLKIYELLDDVAHGSGYFRVKVDNYGLTKGSSSSSQGGVAGVNSLTNLANSGALGSSVNSAGSVDYSNFGGSVSLGGWTASV